LPVDSLQPPDNLLISCLECFRHFDGVAEKQAGIIGKYSQTGPADRLILPESWRLRTQIRSLQEAKWNWAMRPPPIEALNDRRKILGPCFWGRRHWKKGNSSHSYC